MLIDPGHGGSDPGAVYGHAIEKDINLSIALKCRVLDPTVVLTRDRDVRIPLSRRDRDHDGIVVSIHCNAAQDERARGCRVFVFARNRLADVLRDTMPRALRSTVAQVKATPSDWTRRAYNVVTAFRKPVLLLECGFLTNVDDNALLLDDTVQNEIARAIVGLQKHDASLSMI